MRNLFYDEWYKRRLNKIYGIFGKDWFAYKSVLELGCGDGNIGCELLKLGSNVVFADARKEHLDTIDYKLRKNSFIPTCALINQNIDYNLNMKFDLIIHFGVLYHLKNWKNDLRCSLSHTNLMLLESTVYPKSFKPSDEELISKVSYQENYYNYRSIDHYMPIFSQDDVEQELLHLGCKYLRLDDPELNTFSWCDNDFLMKMVYDWTDEKYEKGIYSEYGTEYHFKRFWIVLK